MAHRLLPDTEPSEVFYGGAAGGGKSDWLLAAALEYVDVPGYAAIIFRRSFTDLALPGAIMARSKEWLTATDAVWNEQSKQWRFPSGATLVFAYMDHAGDELRYQSAEFQYVGFDELTQFPEGQYTYLFSRLRRPETGPLSMVPLRQRAASNPGGVGHGWVKRRFPIDGRPRDGRVFVPAKIADNPHLDAVAYRASLSRLGETLQKQLEDGDWNVAEGLAYTVDDRHQVRAFELRDSFDRFEALDYGFNGTPWALLAVDYEGNLVVADLVYERDKMPSEVAPVIVEKRKGGWGFGHTAWADPSIWHRTGTRNKWGQPTSLDQEFSDHGVPITPANNDPRAGMVRVRELLKPDPAHRYPDWHERRGEPGAPRLFFVMPVCAELVEELQAAPTQPFDKAEGGEKVDPEWEAKHGHSAAMLRYAAMSRPRASSEPVTRSNDVVPALERQAFIQKIHDRREQEQRRPLWRRTRDRYEHI